MIFSGLSGRSWIAAAVLLVCGATVATSQSVPQPPPPSSEPAPSAAPASPPREARFALIIGNDGYDNAPLPTAAQDAGLIADTLKAAGFEVMGARNVDQDTFRASYREFLQKLGGAGEGGVGFIYVSGYGLQYEGENYLIPVGATVERETDLALNAIRISDLTRPYGGMPARVKMVVLDLAYKGPFGQQAQLAPGLALTTPEPNMLLAFNAAPGAYAPETKPPYGSYAQALAEMMREGGLQPADIFDRTRLRVSDLTRSTQIPWNSSLIQESFVFFERKAGEPAPGANEAQLETARTRPINEMTPEEAYAAALARDELEGYQEFLTAFPDSPYAKNVRGILAARREAATWQRAVTSNTPNAYWTYIRRYPKGPHVADAHRRLRRLSSPIDPPVDMVVEEFDVPPPPPVEVGYFDSAEPVFYDPVPMPAVSFYAPPPIGWWAPPPPPVLAPEDFFFLPYSSAYAPPPDVYVPDYVYAPALYSPPPGYGYLPFVAAPAVVIAAIAAGRLYPRQFAGRPFAPRVLPPAIRPAQAIRLTNRPLATQPQLRPSNLQRINQQQNLIQRQNTLRQQGMQQNLQRQQQLQQRQPTLQNQPGQRIAPTGQQNLQNLPGQRIAPTGQQNLQNQPGQRPGPGQQNLQRQPGPQGQPNLTRQQQMQQQRIERQQQLQSGRQQRLQQQQQLRQNQLQQRQQQQLQRQQQFQQRQPQIQQRPQIQQPRQSFQPRPQIQQPRMQMQRPAPQMRAPAPQMRAPSPQMRAPAPQMRAPVMRAPVVRAPAPQIRAPSRPTFRR